jgi:hypothetical protein
MQVLERLQEGVQWLVMVRLAVIDCKYPTAALYLCKRREIWEGTVHADNPNMVRG